MSISAHGMTPLGLRDKDAVYRGMVQEAETKGLTGPPPFSTEAARKAWQSGYLAALHDIARGYVHAS